MLNKYEMSLYHYCYLHHYHHISGMITLRRDAGRTGNHDREVRLFGLCPILEKQKTRSHFVPILNVFYFIKYYVVLSMCQLLL